jgi:hypothetical protein
LTKKIKITFKKNIKTITYLIDPDQHVLVIKIHNSDHETMITPNKTIKLNYETQLLTNLFLSCEIRKKYNLKNQNNKITFLNKTMNLNKIIKISLSVSQYIFKL